MPPDVPAPTFALLLIENHAGIRCLLCDLVSWQPEDVRFRYCIRCHLFHDIVADGRHLVAEGGAHECREWRTWHGVCALCGKVDV